VRRPPLALRHAQHRNRSRLCPLEARGDVAGGRGGRSRLIGNNGRGIYEFRLPPRNQIEDLASRWQMELSVRYVF
jgi:hypothetical protein